MANVYEIVTNKIIEKLESGNIPWRKPWQNINAVNWVTQKPYRGINTLLLDPGEYATFKQIRQAGGKVKKGAKGHIVVFWTWIEKEELKTGKCEKIPFLKYYTVFEINTQVEGLNSKREIIEFKHDPITQGEEIIINFVGKPEITFKPDGAYYKPIDDIVNMPPMKNFNNISEYYSTFFHELVHSTGHQNRLNRKEIIELNAFGSEDYSKEELVAELGASMLCNIAKIDNDTIENSVAYIQSWLKVLKDDKTLIIKAAGKAQKAVDHILNIKIEEPI